MLLLLEAIDLAPTFVEAAGGEVPDHWLEGRSLLPLLRSEAPEDWRDYVISEYDYSVTPQAVKLGLEPRDCRLFMVFDGRFKLMHAEGGMRHLHGCYMDRDELLSRIRTLRRKRDEW